jgi:hypothetical protein
MRRLLFWLSMLLVGCDENGPPDRPELPPRPPPSPTSSAGAAPSASASPGSSAVVEIRDRRLELVAPGQPPQGLAFGKGRLARLTDRSLEVFDTVQVRREVSIPMTAPRRVVPTRDGGLLTAASDQVYRLAPGDQSPATFPRLPLFADSCLFADRGDEGRVFLLHGFDPTLYSYRLEASSAKLLPVDEFQALEGLDHHGFAELRDGSFVFSAGRKLEHFYPTGKRTSLVAPAPRAEVWRMLPARRVDEVWVAYRDGRLDLVQIGTRPLVVQSITLPDRPYDLAASDEYLAVVRLEQQPGQPRRFTLVVLDGKGKELLTEVLPNDRATADGNWTQTVGQNKGVAVSAYAPLVAVGGPTWLGVWNIETKARLRGE